jgi:hypothetical protein
MKGLLAKSSRLLGFGHSQRSRTMRAETDFITPTIPDTPQVETDAALPSRPGPRRLSPPKRSSSISQLALDRTVAGRDGMQTTSRDQKHTRTSYSTAERLGGKLQTILEVVEDAAGV